MRLSVHIPSDGDIKSQGGRLPEKITIQLGPFEASKNSIHVVSGMMLVFHDVGSTHLPSSEHR